MIRIFSKIKIYLLLLVFAPSAFAQLVPTVPADQRGKADAERMGTHDANNIRTSFYNFGMVGDYPADPGNVDLSVFHSVEAPKGSGMNYSDGITPFVLAKVKQKTGVDAYIMETGFRERQGTSPYYNRVMRFEPRPGYFQADPAVNKGRSPALSNDSRTWPDKWQNKLTDATDPGWSGSWNGYFGKRASADQESFTVMDDNFYDAWNFFPDSRDETRRGLGLRIEVRGFQWSNPQASNVIFWHYDITNEGTTDYDDNIMFGLYMDAGVGGSALSCDGIYESDDDNAFFDKSSGMNLVYTWDKLGHGRSLAGNCGVTGYLGYAYLETPGNSTNGIDDDLDGITDERRDSGPGTLITGQDAILSYVNAHYDVTKFEATYGPIKSRPAYKAGRWWTGDEDMDWVADLHDTGADGIFGTNDLGENDGIPTAGEANFDQTDLHESDQIGLTGFKMNRIKPGAGNPSTEIDDIVFYDNGKEWPKRLYEKFSDPNSANRFDNPTALNYNIGFLFASGPFKLKAGKTERFSLALAYGADLDELKRNVKTVQKIYDANYQFAVPPPMPTLHSETGDGYVRLSWDDISERGVDPVTGENDFEGYKIYRSTDPNFLDVKVISNALGTGSFGNGKPLVQFDLKDNKKGFSNQVVDGIAYNLGSDNGITHTFIDTNVTNGQTYYYAITSYDYGSDSLGFYPSENAIAVSRTARGGIVLPSNVVEVRPNPKVSGYVPANANEIKHSLGDGVGTVNIKILDSKQVPDAHTFKIKFTSAAKDAVRAYRYIFTDSTSGKILFANGSDLIGNGDGQVALGMLPIINTLTNVMVDTVKSGFLQTSKTNVKFKASYQNVLPIDTKRPGYPDNITILFNGTPLDTSLPAIGLPAKPMNFKILANTASGDIQLKARIRDVDDNGLLNRADEYIDIVTYLESEPNIPRVTWRIELDTIGQAARGTAVLPQANDIYKLMISKPFGAGDQFTFTAKGEGVNTEKAKEDFKSTPYVVPNPYVGSASFEPERFAVSGRGERRIEFRGLPQKSTIRIYTIRGELVQTLNHDGSNDGFVAWDLRTKDNLDAAPGLYIYHVESSVGKFIGKFGIIK